MFYVIRIYSAGDEKIPHSNGYIYSRHTSYGAACAKCFSGRAVIESELDLKAGETSDVLFKAHLDNVRDSKLLSLAVDVLKCQDRAEKISDALCFDIADQELSVKELMESHGSRAREYLDKQALKKQKEAEDAARRFAVKQEVAATEYFYTFPAVRGVQAGREYYVCQVPYRMLVKLFVFNDDESVPPELRHQRELSIPRAKKITQYIVDNPFDYVLTPLTASVSSAMKFESVASSGVSVNLGVLHIPMDATLLINDGQHRQHGIAQAIKEKPQLGDETIGVTLFFDCGLERAQQIFSDINGNAVKPSSSINTLFDHRNPFNTWVKSVLKLAPEVSKRVEKETASVGQKSSRLWSLVAIKKALSALTGITEKNTALLEDQENRDAVTQFALAFFAGAHSIKGWSGMISGDTPAVEVRQDLVIGHAVFLEALASACRDLVQEEYSVPQFDPAVLAAMSKLASIRPEKQDPMWTHRCVIMGNMNPTKTGVNLTANILRRHMAIPLSEEMEAIESKFEDGWKD